MHKRPIAPDKLRQVPTQFSWLDQRLVREHYIDQLSHPACALYLFLVTVADAKGLSFYSEPVLCRRLAMPPMDLHAARQELVTHELLAYDKPLYQVLALNPKVSEPPRRLPRMTADDTPMDIKAMFKQLWEALS